MSDEIYNGLEAEITPDGEIADGHEEAGKLILDTWLKSDSGIEFQKHFGGDSALPNLKRIVSNIHKLGKYLSLISLEDTYQKGSRVIPSSALR